MEERARELCACQNLESSEVSYVEINPTFRMTELGPNPHAHPKGFPKPQIDRPFRYIFQEKELFLYLSQEQMLRLK